MLLSTANAKRRKKRKLKNKRKQKRHRVEVGADGRTNPKIDYYSHECEGNLIQDALHVASQSDPRNADFNFIKLQVHQLEETVGLYEYAQRCVPQAGFDAEYRRNARGLLNFRLISAGKTLSELRGSTMTDVKKNEELNHKVSGWCNDYRVELPAGVTPPFGYFVECCEWYRNVGRHDKFVECTNEAIKQGEWPSIIQRPSQQYTPGLRAQAIWDIEDLPWSRQLVEIAENTPTILEEASVRDT